MSPGRDKLAAQAREVRRFFASYPLLGVAVALSVSDVAFELARAYPILAVLVGGYLVGRFLGGPEREG